MRLVACFALFSLAAPAAAAQSLVPGPNAPGRYEMQPVAGGIARLDTVTGEVTLCRVDGGALRCVPSVSGPAVAAAPRAGVGADDAELDRAIGRMTRLFRAFRDVAREIEGEDAAPDAPVDPGSSRL